MNLFNYLRPIFPFILLLILPIQQARAVDFFSPRTAALGGSGAAGPLLNDSLHLNPSYASFLPTYAVGAAYATYGSKDDPVHGRNYGVSVQDGRNEIFQAGIAYTVRQDLTFFHFGASKSFIQNWGIGLSGKFFINPRAGSNGQDISLSNTYIVSPWVQTALVIDNVIESDKAEAAGLFREIKAGSKFNLDKMLLIYFDPQYSPKAPGSKFGHSIGLEIVAMRDLFLRVGRFQGTNIPFLAARGKGFGLGAGWVAPRISIDYGLSRISEPFPATTHVFGATAFF